MNDSAPLAVLDIGSNTSILLIARLSKNTPYVPEILEDQIFYTGLGEGLKLSKKGYISPQALKRQEECFAAVKKKVEHHHATILRAVGTESARRAKNVNELKLLGSRYGFKVEVISGVQEAELSRWGALLPFAGKTNTVVLDIGGASTEWSTSSDTFSVPLGSVSLTEAFFSHDPPEKSEITKLEQYINKTLSECLDQKKIRNPFRLVACSGTAFTLTCLENKTEENLNKKIMNINKVREWQKKLFSLTCQQRAKLKGMPYYRANIILAGVTLLEQTMYFLKVKEFILSTFGLRHALLYCK